MTTQQGDIHLFQTLDGGDLTIENGEITINDGLETAVYLSLFGGNEDDDSRKNNTKTWWGNIDETNPDRQYRSQTQNLLQAIPATSANLLRIQDAAQNDLKWIVNNNIASTITVNAAIPALNAVKLTIEISAIGKESQFQYTQNWQATTP